MNSARYIEVSINGFGDYQVPAGTTLDSFLREFAGDVGVRRQSMSRPQSPVANTVAAAKDHSERIKSPLIAGRWPFISGAHLDLETEEILRTPLSSTDACTLLTTHVLHRCAAGFALLSPQAFPGYRAPTGKVRLGLSHIRDFTRILAPSTMPRGVREATNVVKTIASYTTGVTAKDGLVAKSGLYSPHTYELRSGLHIPADTPEDSLSSSPVPQSFPYLSVLLPLAMSVVLATIMKQPLFLLFAISSPILLITQHLSARNIEQIPGPRWVTAGLKGANQLDWFLVGSAFCSAGTSTPPMMVSTFQLTSADPVVCGPRLSALGAIRAIAESSASPLLALVPAKLADEFGWLRWLPLAVMEYAGPAQEDIVRNLRDYQEIRFLVIRSNCTYVIADNTTDVVAALCEDILDPAIRRHSASFFRRGWERIALSVEAGRLTMIKALNSSACSRSPHYVFDELDHLTARCHAEQLRLRVLQEQDGSATTHLPSILPFEFRQPNYAIQERGTTTNASKTPHDWSSFSLRLGKSETSDLSVDLNRDGPHMLVAGTTGSGKSEFLQSLIFDAALRFSSAQLNLVLFDYKGGAGLGRANLLPHSTGMVTDLDPSQVVRALDGLHAEIRRREELFFQARVVKLADYNAQCANGSELPRILIVVDEFRALVDDHPNFIQRIVRIAAQGRSLGLYLVLATQRPAGAITPEIRANVPARVCLRVADEQDSLDVLGIKDAAHLAQGTPGRFIVSTSVNNTAIGQSYFLSDAPLSTPIFVPLNRWHCAIQVGCELEGPANHSANDRDQPCPEGSSHRIIDALSAEVHAKPLWAGPLPSFYPATESSMLDSRPSTKVAGTISKGSYLTAHSATPPRDIPNLTATALAALPETTSLTPTNWLDIQGNLLIQGTPLSGKTTALIACARGRASDSSTAQSRYGSSSPATMGIHWIGSMHDHTQVRAEILRSGNTLVNYADVNDPVKTHALLRTLLNRSLSQTPRIDMLLIDGFDSLKGTLEVFDRGTGLGLLENLLRSPRSLGLRIAVATSSTTGFQFSGQFIQRLVLAPGEPETGVTFGVPRTLLPIPRIKGRAVWITPQHAFHCQIAAPMVVTPQDFGNNSQVEDSSRGTQHSDTEACRDDLTVVNLDELPANYPQCGGHRSALWTGPRAMPHARSSSQNLIVVGNDHENRSWSAQQLSDQVIDVSLPDDYSLLDQHLQSKESWNTSVWLKNLGDVPPRLEPEALALLDGLAKRKDIAVIVDCSVSVFSQSFRGPLAEAKRNAQVLLLEPRFGIDKEFAGVPISTAVEVAHYPGKAVLIDNGYAHPARVFNKTP